VSAERAHAVAVTENGTRGGTRRFVGGLNQAAAPRPDPDTPAPVRYLPEYDNVLLSHDDRSRFISAPDRAVLGPGWSVGWGSVLHDGLVRAIWRAEPDGIVVRHVPLSKRAVASVAAEGRRLARFRGLAADVQLTPVSC